ncbi:MULTISPECIES: peptidoglycan hydrolase RipC [Mycobacteriaceae]|uniref:peptidoglycan hydrolase RipC n=1 Tax=Mycobacteriaceae TaxID=1762 RepID=UPI000CF98680|nr:MULTISPECIES: peptidoglycan hydrolase RipC [Mycobacteriaceae]MBJ7463162.1 C40 family peptidase [Mycolicibacterium sp.]MDO0976159.1 peptidoglycan hydrolase RipC [Mycolicibacterium frederiksbergense]WNG80056.1 peptidoglycan hydrolase RipC [Mycobacterium sp. ITM-2016-00316]
MRPDRTHRRKSGVQRPLIGALAALTVFGGILASGVQADPADDALAKLNELSHQAEIATENMHAAQLDLDTKLVAQRAAEEKHAADIAAVEAAKADLAKFQTSVDKIAAAQYMGGRTDGLDSMLTASSPQVLIDQLAVQRVMATEMSAQMQNFRNTNVRAAQAESASAQSAANAKTAAEQAAAVRADLQSKQSKLQVEIAVVKSQYEVLTPAQREALAAIPPVPASVPVPAPEALPNNDPGVLAAPPAGIPPGDVAPPPAAAPGSGPAVVAVQAALTRIGSPYSWGAEGPGAFDCSGLVKWAFQQAGVSLPHSSYAQAAGGQAVSTDQMQPGDVVSYYSDASHVGIYIGDGMMVHASTFGKPVVVAPVNNAPIYNVRRY